MLKYDRVPNITTSDELKCRFCAVTSQFREKGPRAAQSIMLSLLEALLTMDEEWNEESLKDQEFNDRWVEFTVAQSHREITLEDVEIQYLLKLVNQVFGKSVACIKQKCEEKEKC